MTQTAKEIMPQLTATLTTRTEAPLVNTTEWEKWFDFLTTGTPEEVAQLKAMVDAAARFVKAIKAKAQPYWLSLLGNSGNGKTYLAKKIWKWYSRSEHFSARVENNEIVYPGEWCFWPKLAQELLSNQGYGTLQNIQNVKFAVIDEIGSDRDPSGHVTDCLARTLSMRVGKWTIITSNKSLGDIQRDIDTRIASRMIRDGSVVLDVNLRDFARR